MQVQQGAERVISYASCALTTEQRKYCTTRKELLAVVKFTRQFRHYLLGRRFTVRTDHSSLQWLMNFKDPQGQLARWLEELSQFYMVIVHRPGRKHTNVDALSRRPWGTPSIHFRLGVPLKELPCGGCSKCLKAHNTWAKFVEEVDDVIPLAHLDSQPVIQQLTQESEIADGEDPTACITREKQADPDLHITIKWLEEGIEP